jgi:hypothetical protein
VEEEGFDEFVMADRGRGRGRGTGRGINGSLDLINRNSPISNRHLTSIRCSHPFLSLLRPMVSCLEAYHLLLGVFEVAILLILLPSLVCRVTNGLQLARAIRDSSLMERVVPRNPRGLRMFTRRKLF